MGYGEYGGNGSVHWNNENRQDKQNGHSNKKFHGEDAYPDAAVGGDFKVEVFDIPDNSWSYSGGVLTVYVPIKHGDKFVRQIKVSWPDPGKAA
jgi:hypothetical protein